VPGTASSRLQRNTDTSHRVRHRRHDKFLRRGSLVIPGQIFVSLRRSNIGTLSWQTGLARKKTSDGGICTG
jgi:hypothetical protein